MSNDYTSSTNHLSSSAYHANIDRIAAQEKASAGAKGVPTNTIVKKYGMHSILQEYADWVEKQYKAGVDLSNEIDDEDIAELTASDSEILQKKIAVSWIGVYNIFFYAIAVLLVMIILFLLEKNTILISAAVLGGLSSSNYFFLFVVKRTSQYAIGAATKSIFRPMQSSLENFEIMAIGISLMAVASSFFLMVNPVDINYFKEIAILGKFVPDDYPSGMRFVFSLLLVLGTNIGIYSLLRIKLENDYREKNKKRQMQRDTETLSVGDVSENIMEGKYDK